jgi:hypothetical protein
MASIKPPFGFWPKDLIGGDAIPFAFHWFVTEAQAQDALELIMPIAPK